ncbi:MAG: lysine 2,3-aminomutase [Candidatus Schekmanbacteria bacterium]|nr:lysine 2,3-aminomutase [Candidatus Schekmanbacteria bacterium]
MAPSPTIQPKTYTVYTRRNFERLPALRRLSPGELLSMKAVSAVLPFRVNNYVVDELIRWNRVPDDPIYRLTFPHREMLAPDAIARLESMISSGTSEAALHACAREIQAQLNPHPAGQMELNVPFVDGKPLLGMQHKYRETVLFFPSDGQTCHAYCTYCFRWPQFVGIDHLRFASRQAESLAAYVGAHPEVNGVLITGGDPLIMKTAVLRKYVEPLLASHLEHLVSIRIGTKAPAYWPYRFLTDPDADDLIRLFEQVRGAGRHLAIMAHYSHPRELETPAAQAALRRILTTGAVVRCQAPLVRRVNDDPQVWADLWRLEEQLGAVPYYMFVERDTGPKGYFEVPLARACDIFRTASRRVSGLARTVRGPSMSATPGKVEVVGRANAGGEDVFVLRFIQGRNPDWVGRPFFAAWDEHATWLDQLRPAFGETEFFWEPEMREIREAHQAPAWGLRVPKRRKLVLFGHVEWE